MAAAAAKKLGYLFRVRKYFSSSNLYTLYTSQVRPSLEYYSHIWEAALLTTLSILDSIQRRAVRLINGPNLTRRLPSLQHLRSVGDLSLFYQYFHGLCSDEISNLKPSLVRPDRETRASSRRHPYTVQLATPRTSHYARSFIPRVELFALRDISIIPKPATV